MTPRKDRYRAYYDSLAADIPRLRARKPTYYREIDEFIAHNVGPGESVLDLGCGTGDLLGKLSRPKSLGVDFSPGVIETARDRWHPKVKFEVADIEDATAMRSLATRHGAFDWIVLSNCIGEVDDIWQVFRNLQPFCHARTRVCLIYFNYLWEPLLGLASRLGLRLKIRDLNWLPLGDIVNLLELNGFESVQQGYRCMMPLGIPLLASLANRLLVKVPYLQRLGLIECIIARPLGLDQRVQHPEYSVSVIIPCRNEKGNIRAAVERLPHMGRHTEAIFVDGESTDGTIEEIEKVIEEERGRRDIRLVHQRPNKGKGDAVRQGFNAAQGDILMILDADLTAAPEDLPKFYLALAEGKAEFANGSRLVYQMESQAMRFCNLVANKFFAMAFTWLLGQPLRDTLCGTKVLSRRNWKRILDGRGYLGDFDPFGDFDLLFGASRLNLRIREIPVRYRDRVYGSTKISRWRHGVLLLRMCWIALRKLKMR